MKYTKIAFLLFVILNSIIMQSFSDLSVGFVINLEGDFNKETIYKSTIVGAVNTGPIHWETSTVLTNSDSFFDIKALPNHHYNKTGADNPLSIILPGIINAATQIAIERHAKKKNEPVFKELFLEKHAQNKKIIQQLLKDLS